MEWNAEMVRRPMNVADASRTAGVTRGRGLEVMFIHVTGYFVNDPIKNRLHIINRLSLWRNDCRCVSKNPCRRNLQVFMKSSENDGHSSFRVAVTKSRRVKPENNKTEQVQPNPEPYQGWKPSPLVLASATIVVASLGGYAGLKKLIKRRSNLIERCGLDLVRYGTAELDLVDIAEEYKNKWELFFSRTELYEEFLVTLLKERALSFQMLEDIYTVYKTFGLSAKQLLLAHNRAAKPLKERPSALDKLLFVSERILPEQFHSKLEIMGLFPYPKETVRELQRSLAETCFLQLLKSEGRNTNFSPMEKAKFLGLSEEQAQYLYNQYLLDDVQKKDYKKTSSKENVVTTDEKSSLASEEQSASYSKPSSSAAHAYQCQNCGYTLFPAAGREFKFFGDSFVCPQCKSPKSQFIDISNEDDEESDDE